MLPDEGMTLIRSKLDEAAFFLAHLEAADARIVRDEPRAPSFYLSAYLAAARSVSDRARVAFGAWYAEWWTGYIAGLTDDERSLLQFTNEQRIRVIHKRGADASPVPETVSIFELAREGHQVFVNVGGPLGVPVPTVERSSLRFNEFPGESVAAVCRRYLALLVKIADALEVDVRANAAAGTSP